jgi:DNA-binding CsgD family transcriptional regulator/tetratricopeptide (TPR) repeat protein
MPGLPGRTRIRARIRRVLPHVRSPRLPPLADLAAEHNDLVADLLCPVLIGRDTESGQLRSAFGAAAQSGMGRMVFLTGEAGIGKSRLASELADEARARGATVFAGRAVPTSISVPYRPLTEALLQALRERTFPDDPGLTPWLPALRAMIPTIAGPRADDHSDHAAPVRGEAVLQFLRRFAGATGLLLVLEDLHWADPDTLAVVEYLSDNLSAESVLCVATCRNDTTSAGAELVTRLTSRRAASQLALGRLTAGQVAAMVRACLPTAADEVITRVQYVADGIPFLVEESLAASGVPRSFADGVCSRLAALSDDERLVLHTAALLGRQFDWRLLPAATGLPPDLIAGALEHGVGAQLLTVDADAFRFRHMLTREAVAAELLPPRRVTLAARTLAALEAAHPGLPGEWGDLAANLALQAGDHDQAGVLLFASGRSALGRGALATSIDTLHRAVELLSDREQRTEAEMLLVEGLALAGRVDEAMLVGDRLITQMPPGGGSATARVAVHLKLAHAAVDGTRWATARRQLGIAGDLLAADPQAGLAAETAVLNAEVAFADNNIDAARALAESALASPQASPQIGCHALELLGRVLRGKDLDAARGAFEQALATANAAELAVWQLRALHQLGTIDMFDDARTDRLSQARRIADELGAASTGAVIDLQHTAVAMFRYELGEAEHHAQSALATSTRLGLAKTRAIGLLFLGEVQALRRDRAGMDRFLALAHAAEPGDPEIEGSALAGARGMLALLDDDKAGALDGLGRGVAILDTLPQQGPAPYRAVWPLMLAANGDTDAEAAIGNARRIGLTVNRVNRGILGYADAILAGRAGDQHQATELAVAADSELQHYPVWADLARLYAAEPALTDGWGQPRQWLETAADTFLRHGIEPLALRCRRLLEQPQPSRWSRLGITDRQADVLRLVAEGISNKEIAARLHLSPRTVEKHIESLLRKTAARSRTQLVAIAGPESAIDAQQWF